MVKTDFFISPEVQKIEFTDYSLAPTLASVYDDPDVQKKYPFASDLKESVGQAKARPVSPVYPQISQAIYKNVNAALSGKVSAEDALKTADSGYLTRKLSDGTFYVGGPGQARRRPGTDESVVRGEVLND